ncbi:DUF3306 domain-containing protein [Shewanella sp. CG12_big_fil_rev_8_21_14_0_65_47_15]|uniref:DUF3306 domain-containing protein n=1 Tax=Shewanella sp. CG12_big_fil_rev_8_21_14_0_65_47_15 TaxID=1975537 RepID=UPI000CB4517B|nr:DUF3306 domain-containing protein [Shewanella sp. CG12_big_fil_rev_8_21_14_0_65_47_15]PIW62924.1 MAG: DUF3306 domain-containing protein [Shewanella sp. CG12_big_fil_rev_8_21_14_0_65_47_15]
MTDTAPKASGFLSRWTQRREQVTAEEAALSLKQPQTILSAPPVESESEVGASITADTVTIQQPLDEPNRILTAEDLPNPEEIEIGGSFASFMGTNVDPAAKTAALRALWKQPHFNEIDGLLEYALDYSNQPKLSPEVSAELAQKVFRYITKDSNESDEESILAENVASNVPENAMESKNSDVETELATATIADNLDGETDDLPQNAPEPSAQVQKPVV